MKKLLVATHNKGKRREIAAILEPQGWKVLQLDDISQPIPEPEETGKTYEENALIKAKHAGNLSGLLTIADDSGLEVAALPGELGVYSARYAASDAERVAKLLTALKGNTNRSAKFVSCIVLYDPSTKKQQTFLGEAPGTIAKTSKGNDGFGYDPVFIPHGYKETYAELSGEKKNTISHRARALEKLKQFLMKLSDRT
jgi:XTP/dITP diphosphohydrolase